MSFSGNDFFKLTKTFAVVHLDCECRHGGRRVCAGFGSRRDKAPRQLASSLTALDLTNIHRFDCST